MFFFCSCFCSLGIHLVSVSIIFCLDYISKIFNAFVCLHTRSYCCILHLSLLCVPTIDSCLFACLVSPVLLPQCFSLPGTQGAFRSSAVACKHEVLSRLPLISFCLLITHADIASIVLLSYLSFQSLLFDLMNISSDATDEPEALHLEMLSERTYNSISHFD